jgi:N-methylhydantoinase A
MLQKQGARDFKKETWQGSVSYQRSVDIRYRGQGYELNLPFTRNLLADFHEEHKRRYGYAHHAREVEFVTLRLRAILSSNTALVGTAAPSASSGQALGRATLGRLSSPKAPVLFDGKKLDTKIFTRDDLRPGKKYSGPAIITEYSATTVIPPGKHFHLDGACNLIVTIR